MIAALRDVERLPQIIFLYICETENEGVKASGKIWVEIWEKLSEGGDNKALAYEASVIVGVLQTG